MLKNLPKAFTFDTGGTILDWHSGFRNGWEKKIREYGPQLHAYYKLYSNLEDDINFLKSISRSKSPTTIELGVDNIRGSNRAIHDINPIAARQVGAPTTWAETFKQWWKIKQGQPQKSYFTDFTNAERQIIEAIPYNAKKSEVMKTFDKIYKNRQATNPDLGQYTSWSKDLMRGVEQTQLDVFGFDGF